MFVDRQAELAFLDSILERRRPTTAQLILLYGRRRVGKTVLLRHWAEQSGLPTTYWAAEKEPAALQRRKLFARLLGVEPFRAASFDSWADCWQAITAFLADRRQGEHLGIQHLIDAALTVARREDFTAHRGVYVAVTGPAASWSWRSANCRWIRCSVRRVLVTKLVSADIFL